MTVTADALDMLAGDPPRYPHVPGDFTRHPETGAPYVTHPTDTTKDGRPRRVMYGRPSSFGSALDNPFNLVKWKERQLLIGAASSDEILATLLDPDLDPADRDALDGLAARCHEAAGSSLAADRGTHIHLLCECVDRAVAVASVYADPDEYFSDLYADGEALGIPTELQRQIKTQWIAFRHRLRLTALAVEQTVVNDRWRLAGTLDRLDVADHDILTAYGILEAGVPFVGDIKTGGLTVGSDGQPNYWVKYPVQLAAYVDAVPYDTDTDERCLWDAVADRTKAWTDHPEPNPDIAVIYHYDLARALAGEIVDWAAIPVNVQAGREGGDLCRQAADFGKRRDLFAMPAPRAADPDVILATVDLSGSESPGPPGEAATGGMKIAVPAPPVAVEQPATDPEPDTASPPIPVPAADRDRLRARIRGLVDAGHEHLIRAHWPDGVPTLKHRGHTPDELNQILVACRQVETIVGAGWHPDDSPPPQSRDAARRAIAAWGDDINGCWFAASLIATFEQCRLPDCTLDGLVAQFSIEQCERLWEAAPK